MKKIVVATLASACMTTSLLMGAPAAVAQPTSTITAACPATVGYGYVTRGATVSKLQRELNEEWVAVGHPPEDLLVVDGIFGPKTYSDVQNFQMGVGLLADGIVGRQTWSALGVC